MRSRMLAAGLARGALFAACVALPAWLWPHGAVLGYLAQTAALVVLALSYNLQLGTTGLLSFGHAAFAGLGAFAAGLLATRRSGTAFAMITLGLGECVAAAAWSVPAWFGGIGGVPIDRASGTPWGGWHFGAPVQAYAVIAAWCIASAWAMHALTRMPLARLANAVRDNPARVAALGTDPRRVRLAMVTCASFFAGVAGTLTLIDVEIATPDSVSMARSATVLIAAVIGGTGTFFGPAAGAAVLTLLSIVVAGVSRAWALYLGVLFVAIVVAAPRGIAGIVQALAQASRRGAPAAERWRMLCAVAACVFWGVAIVCAAELGYAWRFAQDDGAGFAFGAWRIDADTPAGWAVACSAAGIGALLWGWRARFAPGGQAGKREDVR